MAPMKLALPTFLRICQIQFVFQPCNNTFQFGEIVPTSYHEHTALVKSEMSQANTSTECDRNVRFEIVGDLVQTSKNCDAKHERTFNSSATDLGQWLESGR